MGMGGRVGEGVGMVGILLCDRLLKLLLLVLLLLLLLLRILLI